MDKTILPDYPLTHIPSMRTPTPEERSLGLWLDRWGEHWDGEKVGELRLLGNYGIMEVLEGEGDFFSASTGWLPCRAGMAAWLFPQEPNFYQARGTWRTRWLVFNGPLMDSIASLGAPVPAHPIIQGGHGAIEVAFDTLRAHYGLPGPEAALANLTALTTLVTSLCLLLSPGEASTENRMARIKHYIREHRTEPLFPAAIARTFHLSHSHLRKLFRESEGMSVKAYITRERIHLAQSLLLDTHLSPKQIAESVGYSDYLYFMRVFKQVTGRTVGEFRSQL
ncbi:MAG: AraC family transcriptional regulator [Planctomycetota bacterium]|jgi:AraC-like DNA-binding protein